MNPLPISSDTASHATLATSTRSVTPQQNSVPDNSGITTRAIPDTEEALHGTVTSDMQEGTALASPAEVAQALDEVQSAIKTITNELQFSIDDDTGKTVVKVVDTSTNEVIKQFPSEELLRISKALDKFQGLLLQQEA